MDPECAPAPAEVKQKKKKSEDDDVPADKRVRVAVRIRPFNKADHGDTAVCINVENNKITVANEERSSNFTYDHVFQGTQAEVYASVGEQMLQDAFSGYNTTIFAYGQTGSGKTYSMLGVQDDPDHMGLLPRICQELFELSQELMSEDPSLIIKIQVSFVEIYNEKIRDLLEFEGSGRPTPTDASELRDLKLKEDKKHRCFFVDELSMHTVMNLTRIQKLLQDGSALRTHALTGMNDISSRSHSVFTIYLSQVHEPPSVMDRDRASKITIVDLAGSERQSKTENSDAKRMKEAERINMSLLILGRCLSACSDPKQGSHIPIRDSVLTKMLSDIFGGNSKTLMFATVSPSMFNYGESLSTLQYAYNAKKIKHKAVVNNLSKAIEIAELKEQVKALGRTLVEELEKAAQQKEMLDKEIVAITEERELVASALKTCQQENNLLKQQLEELLAEKERLLAGGAIAPVVPARRKKVVKRRAPRAAAVDSGLDSSDAAPAEVVDDDDRAKERKLAEIHAELSRKLHLVNPMITQMHKARGQLDSSARSDVSTRSSAVAAQTGAPVSEIRSYIGHASAVYCCAFSPTGEKMVSASRDRMLKIWNVKNGNEIITLKGHTGFVLSCAFSPNGEHVVSASDDKMIKIWEAASGKKLTTLKGHTDKVYCCAFSPRGDMIASASCDKTVRVWETATGRKVVTLKGHASAVFSVCFSHDGRKLCSASDDKTLRIWSWHDETELNTLQGHTGTVWSCDFSPDDTRVLSASMDGTIRMWDSRTSAVVRVFRGHSAPVHHAIFSRDGTRIISASRDRTLKVWETETGRVLSTMVGHANTVYHCAVFNNLVLSCSSDDVLKVWNLRPGSSAPAAPGATAVAPALAPAPAHAAAPAAITATA